MAGRAKNKDLDRFSDASDLLKFNITKQRIVTLVNKEFEEDDFDEPKSLSSPGETVLDPYCGSGTTLLEATLLGRRAIGIDLNPLAVLIAEAKNTPIPSRRLRALQRRIGEQIASREDEVAGTLSLFGEDVRKPFEPIDSPKWNDAWFRKWFQSEILHDLIFIETVIEAETDADLKRVARVALSDILRKSSNAASGYPNIMFDKRIPRRQRPLRPFLRALEKAIGMVEKLDAIGPFRHKPSVLLASSTELPLESESIESVVTHPPYIGSIPYAEYGALSLKWLGYDPKELDAQLTGGKRQSRNVVDRFAAGYEKTLRECARVLQRGRFAFFMVGNPLVKGEVIALDRMTIDLASEAGLTLVADAKRQGANRRANKMGPEHLLFFQKPEGDD